MIPILKTSEVAREEIFRRSAPLAEVSARVTEIIETVRREGDAALYRYTEAFDRVRPASLEVTAEEWDAGLQAVEPELLAVLRRAAENIRAFHAKQRRSGFVLTEQPGVVVGQRVLPIEKVGLCVPGGTTPLASTVLMSGIPAKLAGCGEIVMVTPPGPGGEIAPTLLAAARLAGVDRVFRLGGAQAVAALAYGTESVPRVDKIVGPGGAFVAEAKKQVFGQVSIDMIAGPSEILIVSDGKSKASHLAADLLSQAEHDKNAAAVLVTDSTALALEVQAEIETQLPQLLRREIARDSIDRNGKIIVTGDLREAVDIANALAPEHLELAVEEPFALLSGIRHAGSVFLGQNCPEAMGDYYAGPNHTLPTGGTARFSSPLSVDDFVRKSQFIYYSREALDRAAPDVERFARAEGLTGHARSAVIRGEGKNP